MATLAEIGFSIRNMLTGFVSSDDERLDMELIYKKIHDVRAVLIREDLDTRGRVPFDMYQEINCLEVKCEPIVCNGVDSGEVDHYIEIPKLITGLGWSDIYYLGTVGRKGGFQRTGVTQFQYNEHSQLKKKKPYYTIIGGKAYLKNLPSDSLKYISLIGILEDPMNTGCYDVTENDEYPIPAHMIHKMEIIVIKHFASSMGILPDEFNNAIDNAYLDKKGGGQSK